MKAKNKKLITKKRTVKKTVKKPILNHTGTNITQSLKKKVFPYIINDIITACHQAKVGQSIRLGKLGRIKKAKRQGELNGKSYNTITYSFKAFSLLKNK